MSQDSLRLFLDNERDLHLNVSTAVKLLRHAVDRAAERLAKANAQWHDDPDADDHAEYHAPADVQFPRADRDRVALDLVAYWLNELTIREGGQS